MPNTPLIPDALEVAATALDALHAYSLNLTLADAAEVSIRAYLAAAQPVVNSVEKRDQLPVGTIARRAHGLVAVKSANGWLVAGYSKEFPIIDLPFTVLGRPEVNDAKG